MAIQKVRKTIFVIKNKAGNAQLYFKSKRKKCVFGKTSTNPEKYPHWNINPLDNKTVFIKQ